MDDDRSKTPARCTSCGNLLENEETAVCAKCMLQAGLFDTQVSSRDRHESIAETIAPGGEGGEISVRSSDRVSRRLPQGEIGVYQNLESIHDWSGGTVYSAYHPGLDRRVTLRVLESTSDPRIKREFLSRAETLSHLDHPNTITTLEAGEDRGVVFVAEEWIDGKPLSGFGPRTLRERAAEGFFPNHELASAMRDAAAGLQAIHDQGLTHGRLEPDLIVRDSGGAVRVMGLGASAEASDTRFASPAYDRARKNNGQRNTADGGDPLRIGIAEDLYRFGAVFHFLVTGQVPRNDQGDSSVKVVARQLKRSNAGLNQNICEVIARCLAATERADEAGGVSDGKNPYRSAAATADSIDVAGEVVSALSPVLQRRVVRAAWRPRIYSMLLEICVVVLLLGIGLMAWMPAGERPWDGMTAVLIMFVLPIVYVVVLEVWLGWTPARRLFDLRLLDHAGQRGSHWRRLIRSLFRLALFWLAIFLPALLAPLIANSMLLIPIAEIGLPMLLLYLPSRWIPCRWTYYDLICGMTWGEEMTAHTVEAVTDLRVSAAAKMKEVHDRVDQYDIFGLLGSGGMGQVYRGRDRVLGREVAIKVLAGKLIRDPLLLERFQREAQLAAKVSHANVARVFGTGYWNATPYIAMELVRGEDLQSVIKREGPLKISTAWNYVIQAAEALRAADRNGVVHRDIKPSNLMVTDRGQLKVTDFGVSRQVQFDESDVSVTRTGTLVGTPAYMSPEQAMGKPVDCRSDIYALGMTLYQMLVGRPPFDGTGPMEILAQQLNESPPSLIGEVDGMTADQHRLLSKMIAKDKADRYQNYHELLADLQWCAPGADRSANPLNRIAASLCDWMGVYMLFTISIFSLYLLGPRLNLENRFATQLVGWTMTLLAIGVTLMHVVGIALRGCTVGKWFLRTRVTAADGGRVPWWSSVVRFAVAYPLFVMTVPLICYAIMANVPSPQFRTVSSLALALQFVTLIVSLVLLWRHPQRRTVHDLAARTKVVRIRPE